jgi:hypothetical protein
MFFNYKFALSAGSVGGLRIAVVVVGLGFFCGLLQAQESVNKELDNCIGKERGSSAIKGAVAGALLGFLKSAADDGKDTGKNVLAGAAVGGAAGFAVSYFNAVDKCYKKNPSWMPESQLKRGANYEQTKAAVRYDPSMGVVAHAFSISVPESVQRGASLPLESRFIALSPDGAEVELNIERRLFVVAEGKETVVSFPGQPREQRRVEAGEQRDSSKLDIPADMPAGTVLRYEFSVAVARKAESVVTAQTVVR